MASECIAYRDSRGGLHGNAARATLEDLAGVLGRVGDEGGMTPGVARVVFDKRVEIEKVFAEYDAMIAASTASRAGGSAGVSIRAVT